MEQHQVSIFTRKCIKRNMCSILLVVLMLSTTVLAQSVQQTHCMCPRLPGYVTYNGTCPNPNSLMVVKRTLMAKTHDASISNFCNTEIKLQSLDCVLEDTLSAWAVRSACNALNGSCQVTYELDETKLGQCPDAADTYTYACLQYECVTNSRNPNATEAIVYMTSSAQSQAYEMGSAFHLMTTHYASPTSASRSICSLKVSNSVNVLLRLQDLRGRFITGGGGGSACPYSFYINSGVGYKQWCTTTTWAYEEFRVNGTQPSGSAAGYRYIDIALYSDYPTDQTEAAAWVSVETSGEGVSVLCGTGIPLYNSSGGHNEAPPTTTTRSTSTTTKVSTTTTTRPPIIGPSSTATSTTRISSSTTTTRPGPPGPTSSTTPHPGPPGAPSTTTKAPVGPPGLPTTTTKAPIGPPGVSSTTTKAPVGPPGSSSTTHGVSVGPQSSTTKASGPGSSTTTKASGPVTIPGPTGVPFSPGSFTPGVPTPGVPPSLRDSADSVQSYTYTNQNTITVAIAVTVIVVGVILIALLVMGLIWFFKWRHNDTGPDRARLENEYSSPNDGAYDQ